jgi:acetylornithine deacetylase
MPIMAIDPVELLSDLVAIPSVNPMGRRVDGPPFGEERLTEFLERFCRSLGLIVGRQSVGPGQDNLIARLDGDRRSPHGGPLVVFDAHQDTVPVEGMTIEPFRPAVRGGRLYGRGACDTKGGMAAMLAAVARLAELPPQARPTVVLAFTVNEECGFSGISTLVRQWQADPPPGPESIPARRPDAAVTAEPTGLSVVVAHKGAIRWRCHAHGRAAHSSHPEWGDNAIYKMARALGVLERYQRDVVGTLASHPLCGPATMSVGTIQGGVSVNTVPDQCTIEIDRRCPPGESPAAAQRHAIEYLAREAGLGADLTHESPSMQGPPLSDADNGPLAERLAAAVREMGGAGRTIGVPYATDAAFYCQSGVPAVVFGPGQIEQAHTPDEWIELDQLHAAAEIYYRFARSLL